MSPEEKRVLGWCLASSGAIKPGTIYMVKSSFHALLADARGAAGRDIHTGEIVHPRHSASWLAAMGYLCWFDHVGRAVRRPGAGQGRGFYACLSQFSDLDLADRRALWGLRNSFTHGYGLVCQDPGREPYVFTLDTEGPLIQHPDDAWDGTFPIADGHETVVSFRELGNLAEAVKDQVLAAWDAGELATACPVEELESRYVFSYYDDAVV